LIILSVLAAIGLPVYLLDYFLLKPSGDIFLIDLRTMLISVYAAWLAVHIPLSSLVLYFSKTDRIHALHGLSAVASIGLLAMGLEVMDSVEAGQRRAQHEARMAMRKGLADTITLEKWWYVPHAGKPEAIGAVLAIRHSGRLAAHVKGRTAGTDGRTVYNGEMKPQKQVGAGQRVEHIFPLKYYSDDDAPDVSFTFMLFSDGRGSAPEDIFKDYAAIPERVDDGRYFHDILPPPSASPSLQTPR
jgi:hypothetical protein